MQSNNFGKLLIIVGMFLAIIMFFTCNWYGDVGFMENIKFAELICSEWTIYRNIPICSSDAINIKLGEGLIFPLSLIFIGVIILLNIISFNLLNKIFPFIKNSDSQSK